MSCGDQDYSVGAGYFAERVLARKVTRNDGSVSLVEDVSQRPVPKSLFSEAFKDDSIAPMLTGAQINESTIVEKLNDDKGFMDGTLTYSGELTTMELDTVGCVQPLEEGQILQYNGDGVSGQWVNVQPEVSLEKIFIDGKEYLLVDNSGPEERDPVKLQEQIVELKKELDEVIRSIPGPITEGGDYGACGGYIGLPDLTFSGYSTPEFDLTTISLVAEPTSEECKIVSQEEANYERAMNMIGK